MQYAAQNLIPSTTELGGKSPNIFFADVLAADDAFLDKAVEGLVLYAFNKGEVCTCPSRALIQESIYDEFMASPGSRRQRPPQRHGDRRPGTFSPVGPFPRSGRTPSQTGRVGGECRRAGG
jgi:acyl-CoA reductase-like NAD-dependent aldehyde dehydrogenase